MVSKQKINKILDSIHLPHWLSFYLLFLFILRIPSLFEPFYYGDEMIYLTLGNAVRRGLVLYKDVHDNKPPLLYLLSAVVGNVFWFRAALALWASITIGVFWKLSNKFFAKDKKISIVATVIFGLFFTIPALEGQIANAENFMVGFILLGFLVSTLTFSAKRPRYSFLVCAFAGLMFSTAILFKMPSFFDVGALVIVWFTSVFMGKKKIGDALIYTSGLVFGVLLPILFSFVWYYYRGALPEYMVAAFLQNFGYLSSWSNSKSELGFLAKNAMLLIRGGVVGVALLTIFAFRRRLSFSFIFITSWFLLSLFAATLSGRPYPHYLLQVLPSLSLLFGMLVYRKNMEQVLVIPFIFLFFFVFNYFSFWNYSTLDYYQRFVNFARGDMTTDEYLNSFDRNVSRNYKLSTYLSSRSRVDDSVFVWGDSPSIYALSRRLPPIKYVAYYHIVDFSSKSSVYDALSTTRPEFIVILPESAEFSELNSLLSALYLPISNIDGALVWRLR